MCGVEVRTRQPSLQELLVCALLGLVSGSAHNWQAGNTAILDLLSGSAHKLSVPNCRVVHCCWSGNGRRGGRCVGFGDPNVGGARSAAPDSDRNIRACSTQSDALPLCSAALICAGRCPHCACLQAGRLAAGRPGTASYRGRTYRLQMRACRQFAAIGRCRRLWTACAGCWCGLLWAARPELWQTTDHVD